MRTRPLRAHCIGLRAARTVPTAVGIAGLVLASLVVLFGWTQVAQGQQYFKVQPQEPPQVVEGESWVLRAVLGQRDAMAQNQPPAHTLPPHQLPPYGQMPSNRIQAISFDLDQPQPPDPAVAPGNVESYGEEPTNYNQQFLRTETILLQPGEWQFDYGLAYQIAETHFPELLVPGPGVIRTDVKQRLLFAPFAFRLGVTERMQVYTNIPVVWSHNEVANSLVDANSNKGGIGDVQLGLNYLLCQGDYYSPDVILTFQTTLPTANKGLPVNPTVTNPGLGVWAASTQLLFVQTYDPVTAFWGLGYRYQAEDDFGNLRIRFGHQFSYNLGVGFALNDRVTLSTSFLGLYQTETEINGQGLPGSTVEPLRLRFAVTAFRKCRIVEPFATIGMTDDAPSSRVGIVWTY